MQEIEDHSGKSDNKEMMAISARKQLENLNISKMH